MGENKHERDQACGKKRQKGRYYDQGYVIILM